MRHPFIILLLISVFLPLANALPPRRVVVAEEAPQASNTPVTTALKRESFLQRIFGPRATPTPAPAPTPTPAPVRRPRRKSPAPASAEQRQAAVVKMATPDGATPAPAKRDATKPAAKAPAAPVKRDYSGLDDTAKFKAVKTDAMADPKIQELKAKADGALDPADADKALAEYNRALFRKIREIEPGISDYAGKVESSLVKRLGAEKAKQ